LAPALSNQISFTAASSPCIACSLLARLSQPTLRGRAPDAAAPTTRGGPRRASAENDGASLEGRRTLYVSPGRGVWQGRPLTPGADEGTRAASATHRALAPGGSAPRS